MFAGLHNRSPLLTMLQLKLAIFPSSKCGRGGLNFTFKLLKIAYNKTIYPTRPKTLHVLRTPIVKSPV